METGKSSNLEWDWSLHTWQLPLTASSHLSKAFPLGQMQYVSAKHLSPGCSRWQELSYYNEYVQDLDQQCKDNNHASFIMPVIKEKSDDSSKWRCCLSKEKLVSMAKQSLVGGYFPSPSDKEIEKFALLFDDAESLIEEPSERKENVSNFDLDPMFEEDVLPKTKVPSNSFHFNPNRPKHTTTLAECPPHQTVTTKPFHSFSSINESPKVPSLMPLKPKVTSANTFLPSNVRQNNMTALPKRSFQPATHSHDLEQRNLVMERPDESNIAESSLGSRPKYPWQRKNSNNRTSENSGGEFRSASHQLMLNRQKQNNRSEISQPLPHSNSNERRSLGTRGSNSKFVLPIKRDDGGGVTTSSPGASVQTETGGQFDHLLGDPRLKNVEPKMVELIMNEVVDVGLNVAWDDIAGLEDAKATIQEVVVWPMLRPDIFTGLRGPPKGVLLFGPPGTGKTMIGKAIASQSKATFFSISASSLTSKWIGEGEKMVRALFAISRIHSPSVIFIDEIDSLLCQRSETEHESSRRLKTEFLVQLDGVGALKEQVLVVGATNRPQELDEAARRRLVKRMYIPLPDKQARVQLVSRLLTQQRHSLGPCDVEWIADHTEGYSGADVASVCSEAAMGPIRSINPRDMHTISLDQVRAMNIDDFKNSVSTVKPSVCPDDLTSYEQWNSKYGIARTV